MRRLTREPELEQWTTMAEVCDMLHEPVCFRIRTLHNVNTILVFCGHQFDMLMLFKYQVRIAIVGKYTSFSDTYLSIQKVHLSPTYENCNAGD